MNCPHCKKPTHSSEFEDAWAGFVEMRKKIKKPLTKRAESLTLKKLETLAPGDKSMQVAILDQSIMLDYLGVFPLKQDSPRPNATASQNWNGY
jgi:uncharacterized protein (DUF2225 family)